MKDLLRRSIGEEQEVDLLLLLLLTAKLDIALVSELGRTFKPATCSLSLSLCLLTTIPSGPKKLGQRIHTQPLQSIQWQQQQQQTFWRAAGLVSSLLNFLPARLPVCLLTSLHRKSKSAALMREPSAPSFGEAASPAIKS